MAEKYEELIQKDLYTPLDTFNGDLTGYALIAHCVVAN